MSAADDGSLSISTVVECSAVKFRNPPVVEIWITFTFESNENKVRFDESIAKRFMDQYVTELPELEVFHEKEFDLKPGGPRGWPKVVKQRVTLKWARRTNADRSRAIHLQDDAVACHICKAGNDVPRYNTAKEQATSKVRSYLEHFRPAAIRNATLHYLDIIEIPAAGLPTLDLKDWFAASTDLPVIPFGPITRFSYRFEFATLDEPSVPMFLQIRSLPNDEERGTFRFRMDWHRQTPILRTLDLDEVWAAIDETHVALNNCFAAAFTQRTLDLFGHEPE